MKSFAISFLGRTLTVEAPDDLVPRVAAFFALAMSPHGSQPTGRARIAETAPGRFALVIDERPAVGDLTRGDVVARLAAELTGAAAHPAGTVALKAAAVGWNDKAILIVGADGAGKSALAAWLIDKGFAYLADNSVVLSPTGDVSGFPGPLGFDPAKLSHVASLPGFRDAPSLASGGRMLIGPDVAWQAVGNVAACGLIINVRYEAGGRLHLEPLTVQQTAARLDTSVAVVDAGAEALTARVAAQTPALRVAYGNYAQLAGLVDFLGRVVLDASIEPGELTAFLERLPRASSNQQIYPVPARTERVLRPRLTIGMATYDDYDGVYFSIQAIRLYHPEVVDDLEFVVVDNNPSGPCSEPLKKLENAIPNYRYIPMGETTGTAGSRDRVFSEAQGRYVLCMDCHVLIVPGALKRLIDHFERDGGAQDLLQGPLIYDDLKTMSTHLDPQWRAGFYGTWATKSEAADPNAPPFEVELQGLGLFACRKLAWPGFNPEFRGFGGEEGYIHEKIRRAGGRTLCLPFLRWVHRFARPMGVPYPNIWEERIRNYLIGAHELGLSIDPMRDHFAELLGAIDVDRILAELGETGPSPKKDD